MSTLGSQIDAICALQEKKKKLDAEVKKLETEIAAKTEQLLADMDTAGTTLSAGKKGKATVTESKVFNIKDYDAFCAYMSKKKAFFLLQRRVAVTAMRELYESGTQVPGIEPYTKRELKVS